MLIDHYVVILTCMKKSLLFLPVLIVLLSACSGPNPNMSDVQDPNSDSYSLSNTSISESNTSTNNKKDTMITSSTVKKSVSEFEPITASEATLKTSKGDITVELYQKDTPVTVANFLDLASKKYYDGIVFHRVIPDFMAQVGDPKTKDASLQAEWGTGGPGYTIIDEFKDNLKHDGPGVLSMANTGQPSTGGSQFFITFEATPWLDGKHTVFGKVTTGLDVLEKIEQGDKIISVTYK